MGTWTEREGNNSSREITIKIQTMLLSTRVFQDPKIQNNLLNKVIPE